VPKVGAREVTPAECVINISEGRDPGIIALVARAAGDPLLDVHTDAEHHRSVLTLAGDLPGVEAAARSAASAAVGAIDLRAHHGIHPRLGAVDVVPFVPLPGPAGPAAGWDAVLAARDAFAGWMATSLGVPCFLYGPGRTLPEIRRGAFTTIAPDVGPPAPHPSAGACAVGARDVLIAYNVWIRASSGPAAPDDGDVVSVAKSLAGTLRGPGIRTLGLAVAGGAQVSCNLIDPAQVGVADVYDTVAQGAASHGCTVWKGELVGLLPRSALAAVPDHRWAEVGLRAEDTIEFRLDARRG
jgi:glutamate formiminotransferase / 5-formyltetrahydrofolate cyclo-ligase